MDIIYYLQQYNHFVKECIFCKSISINTDKPKKSRADKLKEKTVSQLKDMVLFLNVKLPPEIKTKAAIIDFILEIENGKDNNKKED